MVATTSTPLPDTTATSLSDYHIPPRLQARWTNTTGHDALLPGHQASAFALFNRYMDVHMVLDEGVEAITDALLLHIVNHCTRAADTIKRNNDAPEPRPRDQGFARTKALILLPMRNAAASCVLRLCSMAQRETRADSIQNKQRFLDEYTLADDEEDNDMDAHAATTSMDPATRALRNKPADHRARFSGNTDDHFRLGIKITRGAVRLYTDFFDSDIVVASPIALVTMLEEQGPGSLDWAASVEIVALPSADVLLMQNWQHVRTVVEHVNRKPTALHDAVDIMRVRDVYLTNQGSTVRQLVCMAPFATAETNSLFNTCAKSHAGSVRILPRYDDRVLRAVVPQLRQLFRRVDTADDDTRFTIFTTQLYPRIRESGLHGQLIVVPSYLDFVRIRRFLDSQDAPWDAITEYTPPKEAAQLRAYFSSKRRRILVYTERAHFYHRYTLHGVHDVVFYQLPVHAGYYAELLNMMALRSAGEEHGTVTVLFDARDALLLERVVGTRRARRMIAGDGGKEGDDTFLFV